MKSIPNIFVSLAVGALLSAGVLPRGAPPLRAEPRALVVMLGSEPATLDPFLATDALGVRISHQLVFETLLRLNDDLEIAPGLASWRRLAPTRYRFQLRPGVRFHDGTPLEARDAVFTLRRFMAPETGSPYGAALREQIASLRTVDGSVFEVELKAPYASFLADLILPVVSRRTDPSPSPAHSPSSGAPSSKAGISLNGSGPFRFAGRPVGEIVLERNPHFDPPAGVERVVFKVVRDEGTRLLKLRKGDVHLGVNVLPLDKLARFSRAPLKERYTVLEAPGLSFQYLGFNLTDPALSRLPVRRALAHAIDVEALIRHRQKGHSTRATGLMAPGSPYGDPTLRPYPYDPERAAQLLEEAGYPLRDGKRLSLTYKTSTDRSAVIQARIIQSDLRKVGVEVEVRSYEWATFYDDIKKGNFQLYSLRWIGVSDPGFLYELLHSAKTPPGGRNRGRYANGEVDALLEQARLEPEPGRRRELYRRVHRKVYEDPPYVSLWHNNNVAVVSREIAGFRLHPSGGFEHLAEVRWVSP